jgi:hypothetical protein
MAAAAAIPVHHLLLVCCTEFYSNSCSSTATKKGSRAGQIMNLATLHPFLQHANLQ